MMNPKYKINLVIPGLGRNFFIHPNHINAKGGAERHIPSLGEHVMIPSSCISTKGGAEKYIPGLGKYFFINPKHVEGALVVSLSQSAPVNKEVSISASVTGVAPVVTKYLSGTKSVADFASSGTAFTGVFKVTANGAYTVYAKDALGMESVSTITISAIV